MEKHKKDRSPNLEVISKVGDQGDHGDLGLKQLLRLRERRNLPRLCLSNEQFKHRPTGKIFAVADLSVTGMGLWLADPEERGLFSVGAPVEGTLNLKREKYALQGKVRYSSNDRIGCEFAEISGELRDAISAYLDPVRLGAEMKLIPAPDVDTLWYHGPSGTDLVFKRGSNGQIQKIILSALGIWIQWETFEGLITGVIEPPANPSEIRGIHRLETFYVDEDQGLDPKKLEIAKKVILSSNLPQETKDICIQNFHFT